MDETAGVPANALPDITLEAVVAHTGNDWHRPITLQAFLVGLVSGADIAIARDGNNQFAGEPVEQLPVQLGIRA